MNPSFRLRILGSCVFALALSMALVATSEVCAAERPLSVEIDEQIEQGWKARKVEPAALCTDAEFLRRVTIDLTGTIPTAAQVREFLADKAADKRTKLVDKLLASHEHARHMQHVFDVFLLERQHANYVTEKEWRDYLRQSFLANKPWDQLAREMLGTDGLDPATRPALRFAFVRTEDSYRKMNANALTRDVGRLLLGVNLQCAQCHDHPSIADYKQADYHGLLAFISRSYIGSVKQADKTVMVLAEKADGEVKFTSVFDREKKEHRTTPHLPGAPQIVEPMLEKGKEYTVAPADGVKPVPAFSRREQMAKMLPSADNRGFARNMANRLWAMLFGRGLVHPVEVHHAANPASHPQLMELLSKRFIASKFDMRYMLREMALSRAYQRSSAWPAGKSRPPADSFAVREPRGLSPETLALAVMQATGYTDSQRKALADKLNEATLYERLAPALANFTKVFAGPAGQAETEFQASLDQALFLEHGGQVQEWVASKPGTLLERVTPIANPAEEMYLCVLSRPANAEEANEVAELCRSKEDRPAALQDLLWALIASTEFRFNH